MTFPLTVLNLQDSQVYRISSVNQSVDQSIDKSTDWSTDKADCSCRKSWQATTLRLFTTVNYIFYDEYRHNFYVLSLQGSQQQQQQQQPGVWLLSPCLTARDDNQCLYTIVNGKIVDKQAILLNTVDRITAADLNSDTVIVPLLCRYSQAVWTSWSALSPATGQAPNNQITADPNDDFAAIVNNHSFGLFAVLQYYFYPVDQVNYNKVIVNNSLAKTAITLPQGQISSVTFNAINFYHINCLSNPAAVELRPVNTLGAGSAIQGVDIFIDSSSGNFGVNVSGQYSISMQLNNVVVDSHDLTTFAVSYREYNGAAADINLAVTVSWSQLHPLR